MRLSTLGKNTEWHSCWMFLCLILHQNYLIPRDSHSFSASKVHFYDLVKTSVSRSLSVFLHSHTVSTSFRIADRGIHLQSCTWNPPVVTHMAKAHPFGHHHQFQEVPQPSEERFASLRCGTRSRGAWVLGALAWERGDACWRWARRGQGGETLTSTFSFFSANLCVFCWMISSAHRHFSLLFYAPNLCFSLTQSGPWWRDLGPGLPGGRRHSPGSRQTELTQDCFVQTVRTSKELCAIRCQTFLKTEHCYLPSEKEVLTHHRLI